MSQLRSDAVKTPQEQHDYCMTKNNEIQTDKKDAFSKAKDREQEV